MKDTQGMVSIILPVYNRERYIEECIDSVFAQSYQNFEIVIVDDGSSDHTYSVCERLAQSDQRIKLFASDHGGVSAARNKALSEATGEYVFFLDSDDVIHPFLLETLVAGMCEHQAAIGATNVVRAREEHWDKVRYRLENAKKAGEVEFLSETEIIAAALGGSSPLRCIGGVMMRRDFVANTKFRTDLYIGEDFYFIYENIIKGSAGVFLKQKWYYVRNHANNSSWDYSVHGFWTRFHYHMLVWKSEETFGRTKFADMQKRSAFDAFLLCVDRNKPYSEDAKKMRDVLKEYKNDILPILSFKSKLLYLLYLYLPASIAFFRKMKKRLSKKQIR